MPVTEKDALRPSGFEGSVNDCPQDPQAAHNAGPLVRSSSTTGTREGVVYPQQAGGMTPRRQGQMP